MRCGSCDRVVWPWQARVEDAHRPCWERYWEERLSADRMERLVAAGGTALWTAVLMAPDPWSSRLLARHEELEAERWAALAATLTLSTDPDGRRRFQVDYE